MIKKLAEDYAAAHKAIADYTKARNKGTHTEEMRAGLAKHRQVIKGVERQVAEHSMRHGPSWRAEFDSHVSAAKSGKVLIQTPSPSVPIVAAPEVSRSHPLPVQRRMGKERFGSRADALEAVSTARYLEKLAKREKAAASPQAKPALKLTSTNYRNLVDAARPSGTHVKNLTVAEQRRFESAGLIKPGDGHHVQITDAGRALLEAEKIPHYKPPAQVVAAPAKKFDEAAFAKATQYGHAPPTFLKDSERNHAIGLSQKANSASADAAVGRGTHEVAREAHRTALEAHRAAGSPVEDTAHHDAAVRTHAKLAKALASMDVVADRASKQHAEAKSWDQKPHDPKAAAAADRASQMRSDAIRAGKTDFLGRPTDSFRKEWEAKNAPKAKRLVSAAKPAANSVRVVNLKVPRAHAHVIADQPVMRSPYQATAPRATPKAGMKAPASAIRIGKKGGRFILSASGQKHYV
jgi:hypothetical protein